MNTHKHIVTGMTSSSTIEGREHSECRDCKLPIVRTLKGSIADSIGVPYAIDLATLMRRADMRHDMATVDLDEIVTRADSSLVLEILVQLKCWCDAPAELLNVCDMYMSGRELFVLSEGNVYVGVCDAHVNEMHSATQITDVVAQYCGEYVDSYADALPTDELREQYDDMRQLQLMRVQQQNTATVEEIVELLKPVEETPKRTVLAAGRVVIELNEDGKRASSELPSQSLAAITTAKLLRDITTASLVRATGFDSYAEHMRLWDARKLHIGGQYPADETLWKLMSDRELYICEKFPRSSTPHTADCWIAYVLASKLPSAQSRERQMHCSCDESARGTYASDTAASGAGAMLGTLARIGILNADETARAVDNARTLWAATAWPAFVEGYRSELYV